MSAGSDYTRVLFAAMQQGQADFQRTYASLQAEIEQLESQLNANLAEWAGPARQAYHEAQAQWNAAMASMQSVIQQLGVVIGQANDNYTQAEAHNTSLWG